MSTTHEITGFVRLSRILVKPPTIIMEGDFRKNRNDVKSGGKIVMNYSFAVEEAGKVLGPLSIPEYTLRVIQKEMAYLANDIRVKLSSLDGVGAIRKVELEIDELFELRTSVLPRKIHGTSEGTAPDTEGKQDRWKLD
jgi:hypothetical protein